jgi:hypothetical protein
VKIENGASAQQSGEIYELHRGAPPIIMMYPRRGAPACAPCIIGGAPCIIGGAPRIIGGAPCIIGGASCIIEGAPCIIGGASCIIGGAHMGAPLRPP